MFGTWVDYGEFKRQTAGKCPLPAKLDAQRDCAAMTGDSEPGGGGGGGGKTFFLKEEHIYVGRPWWTTWMRRLLP
jgi:hypothetical protein